MPLAAIDFAAHGGTNFAMLELLRANPIELSVLEPLTKIGHSAEEMVEISNKILESNHKIQVKELIISGGVSTFLDGYYLTQKSKIPAIYGQASGFLKHSLGEYNDLKKYVETQIKGLKIASAFLKIKA
jgi:isopentenyl-diphosphate delta-isomerase